MVSRDGILGGYGQQIWYTRREMVYWVDMVRRDDILSEMVSRDSILGGHGE